MDKDNYRYRLLIMKKALIICLTIIFIHTLVCAIDRNINSSQRSLEKSKQEMVTEHEEANEITYDITRFDSSSGFLSLMYNDEIYYYAGLIYDKSELLYYITLAEFVGNVEFRTNDEAFPKMNLETNYLEVGTKLYSLEKYIIAVFENPQKWQGKVICGQILILDNE